MVIEQVNGDPEAITDGYAPAGVFGPDPVRLCIANPGYNSDVAFQVNLGELGDLNWLDAGDPAMISFNAHQIVRTLHHGCSHGPDQRERGGSERCV